MKVILFCPVREKASIFRHAIAAHSILAGVSERWYYADTCDGDPEPFDVFGESPAGAQWHTLAAHGHAIPGSVVGPDEIPGASEYRDHNWTPPVVSRVAAIKDAAIREFLDTDADALFLIDADVIPHPALVERLLSLDIPIVSEVYWTKWKENEPYLPQVWDYHGYGFHKPENILRLKSPGIFGVGGLGACTLICREALEHMGSQMGEHQSVWFAPVPGIQEWGEDRHFCTRAAASGIPLLADTNYPPFHVYRESQIEEMERWREAGSPPEYFREVWLDDEWERGVRKMMRPQEKKTIAVCMPHEQTGWLWNSYGWDLHAHLVSRGFTVGGFFGAASDAAIARGAMLEAVQSTAGGVDLLLWIDDDQLLSAAQFDRLYEQYQALPAGSILAAWTWMDTAPEPRISAGILTDDGNDCKTIPWDQMFAADKLVEVQWTGFPVVLMSAETARLAGNVPFARIPAPNSRWGAAGEDVSFCVNAKQRGGVRIFVDPKVWVPHLKDDGVLGIDGARTTKYEACRQAQGWLSGEMKIEARASALCPA